jgi:cold shock CspA family protein
MSNPFRHLWLWMLRSWEGLTSQRPPWEEGVVLWYSPTKRYGYIRCPRRLDLSPDSTADGGDVFFDDEALPNFGVRSPVMDERVRFVIRPETRSWRVRSAFEIRERNDNSNGEVG